MSGDGKRSVAKWPKLPRPSSTLPSLQFKLSTTDGRFRGIADSQGPTALPRSVVNDLGCVKTPKTQKRLEWFFSSRAKLKTLKNIRTPECDLAERSFYRLRAAQRFYTAKTHFGHAARIKGGYNEPARIGKL